MVSNQFWHFTKYQLGFNLLTFKSTFKNFYYIQTNFYFFYYLQIQFWFNRLIKQYDYFNCLNLNIYYFYKKIYLFIVNLILILIKLKIKSRVNFKFIKINNRISLINQKWFNNKYFLLIQFFKKSFNNWMYFYIHKFNYFFLANQFLSLKIIKINKFKNFKINSYPHNTLFIVFNSLIYFLLKKNSIFYINIDSTNFLTKFDILIINDFFFQFNWKNFIYSNYFHPKEFFILLYFSFKWKDFYWCLNFLQLILKKLIIFKHKSFFIYLFTFIESRMFHLFNYFKIVGFFFSLKGKLGVAGDSRKRRLFLNLNHTSRFDLTKRVFFKNTIFKTISGAVGVQIWLFY